MGIGIDRVLCCRAGTGPRAVPTSPRPSPMKTSSASSHAPLPSLATPERDTVQPPCPPATPASSAASTSDAWAPAANQNHGRGIVKRGSAEADSPAAAAAAGTPRSPELTSRPRRPQPSAFAGADARSGHMSAARSGNPGESSRPQPTGRPQPTERPQPRGASADLSNVAPGLRLPPEVLPVNHSPPGVFSRPQPRGITTARQPEPVAAVHHVHFIQAMPEASSAPKAKYQPFLQPGELLTCLRGQQVPLVKDKRSSLYRRVTYLPVSAADMMK